MDSALADPLVGALLDGRYRVRGVIAHGGMATVYDAVDERLERTVAVKVMSPSYANDPLFIQRFLGEARAVAALSHPNVVAVYDQGSHGRLAFLVMEQVKGQTLRDILNTRGRLTVPEAVGVLESVLDALAAAHRYGLVHRDVKPENVLVGVDGQVKVADFGLARAVAGSGQTATRGVMMGTVAYVSPEQIAAGQADTRSDVYSAGIMLYEMLTGEVPFAGESAVSVAFQHVHSDVPPPSASAPNIPWQMDELVRRTTRRDPAGRPADAGVFLGLVHDIRADLGMLRIAVAATPPGGPPTRPISPAGRYVHVPGPPEPPGYDGSHTQVVSPTQVVSHRPPPQGPPVRTLVLAGVAVLVLALLAVLGWQLLGTDTTPVPSLANLTKEQAEQRATSKGLKIAFTEEFNDTVKAGLVFRQDPAADKEVPAGTTITAVVSKGPETVVVPDVTNLLLQVARDRLKDAGLLKTRVVEEYSASVEKGSVVSTTPKAKDQVKKDQEITLVVSKGAKPVTLPNLVGKTREEAEAVLKELGLTPDVEEREVADPAQAGRVIAQEPGPGPIPGGNVVKLVVGKGASLVMVPDVTGLSVEEATRILQDAGLRVTSSGFGSQVALQSPSGGSTVPRGTQVTLLLT